MASLEAFRAGGRGKEERASIAARENALLHSPREAAGLGAFPCGSHAPDTWGGEGCPLDPLYMWCIANSSPGQTPDWRGERFTSGLTPGQRGSKVPSRLQVQRRAGYVKLQGQSKRKVA